MTQELAESVKRLRERADYLGIDDAIQTINELVQLVGEMETSIKKLQTHARGTNNILERKCKMYEICLSALDKAQPIAALAKGNDENSVELMIEEDKEEERRNSGQFGLGA